MDLTDEQIMLDYISGRKEAAQMIFNRYKLRILNFCWRILGNRGEAEDVAGEVFLSLFTNQYVPQLEVKFSTWLYTVARNRCIDTIRIRSRYTSEEHAEAAGKNMELGPGPQDQLAVKETGDHVREAITRLSPEQREAIVLQHYEGLSYEEISKVLDCSLDKVKVLIFRAKEKLRVELAFILKEGQR